MRNRHATIVGFVVLIVLLSAGAAQSLAGSNTVTSDDILDGQVYTTDIRDSTIAGIDVKNNSLTGADIDESSLSLPDSSESGDKVYKWTATYTSDGTSTNPTVVADDEIPPNAEVAGLDIDVPTSAFSTCRYASVQAAVGDLSPGSPVGTSSVVARAEFDKDPFNAESAPGESFEENLERPTHGEAVRTGSVSTRLGMRAYCQDGSYDFIAVPSFTAEVIFRVRPLAGTPETFE